MALADCKCVCKSGSDQFTVDDPTSGDGSDCGTICSDKNATYSGTCTELSSSSQGKGDQVKLTDPLSLSSNDPLADLLSRIVKALLGFIGVASLVVFIYSGFMFLFSAGNTDRVKKAKDTMVYAVIGVFVAMASYAILSFIFKALRAATGN